MDLLSSIVGIISALAGIGAVLVPLWLWLRSQKHPFLVPVNDLLFDELTGSAAQLFEVYIHNAGSPAATHVWGLVLGPQETTTGYLFHGKASLEEKETMHIQGGERVALAAGNTKLRRYNLFPSREALSRARITLVYEDTSGHTYTGIFDYTSRRHWQRVTFLRGMHNELRKLNAVLQPAPLAGSVPRIDWGEAPNVEKFCGRQKELDELKRWVLTDSCRLVAVLGIGGIGKTALAARLVEEVQGQFTSVFWRSLQNAPPVEKILAKCLLFFGEQQHAALLEELDEQLLLLNASLTKKRCLLILDNVETIMQEGDRAGRYREGYEGYGRLFQRVGEARHTSCLLLTSRELPREVALLEGKVSSVRALELAGVGPAEGREILNDKGLFGSDEVVASLIQFYAGNPLALRLIAEPVQRLFQGNIQAFLRADTALFGDISDLLDRQFRRLSEGERSIMYWLAIEREAVALEDLQHAMVDSLQKSTLLAALALLQGRSMIEANGAGRFSLQPVILAFVTERFRDQICEEIGAGQLHLIHTHALMKAQAREYIRQSQLRLILAPVAERLQATPGREGLAEKLRAMLLAQRQMASSRLSYTAGNVLHLLGTLNYDLRGYDFSRLMIVQAYLQDSELPEVNFSRANFRECVFTDTFGSIFSVILSVDEKVLVAGTDAGDIQFWEIASAAPTLTFYGHADWVRAVAFNPGGHLLASGSDDQTVRLWDVATGQCLRILEGHTDWVRAVAFSPGGHLLASGSDDQTVRLWDVATGQCLRTLEGHADGVMSLAFGVTGEVLATGSEDHTVKIWDVAGGHCLQTLTEHSREVMAVAFRSDGQLLASGSCDQSVKLWDVTTWQCLKTLQHANEVHVVAFSQTGLSLASGGVDRVVRIWDAASGQCLKTLQGHSSTVSSVLFGRSDTVVISGGEDRMVKLWDVAGGQCLKTLQGYTNGVRAVSFSLTGRVLAIGGTDQCVRLWDVATWRCVRTLRGHSSGVRSLAYSGNGQLLASGSHDRTVKIWDAASGQCLKTLQAHTAWVWAVAFSPDGQLLASGSHDRTVKIWDAASGQCLRTLHGHAGGVRSLVFQQKHLVVLSGSEDCTVKVWDASGGACLKTLEGHTRWVKSVACSPGGDLCASGSEDRTVKIWDARTWECLCTLHGHSGWIMAVAFSADGSRLASGDTAGSIKIWDTQTRECLCTLHGHSGWVMAVAFSPLNGHLVSGGNEGISNVWDVRTGQCLQSLRSGPYDRMNIADASGLTDARRAMLKTLGAVEQ
ncbi:MAG TPA: NB-ARC domain-containing protein [Ktedonobacteraceae bacterium]